MTSASESLNSAVAHQRAGRVAEAEQLYRRVLTEMEPDNPVALHLLSLLQFGKGELGEGISLTRRSLAVEPLDPTVYANFANHLARHGYYGDAVACYRRALALAPERRNLDGPLDSTFRLAVAKDWQNAPLDGDKIVIYQHNPGLGDNLLFSTLPELFVRQGKKVFVSDKMRVRNKEIFDLVWRCNPFVSGISSAPPLAGMAQVFSRFHEKEEIANWLTRIEVIHGFQPTSDLPKIYYQPKPHPVLSNRVLVETHSKTIRYPSGEIVNFVQFIKNKYKYKSEDMVQLNFGSSELSDENGSFEDMPSHTIGSIFELCDAIFSARALITVHSGGNSLAAAIKGNADTPSIHCAVDAEHYNQKCYIWRNVDYSIVRSLPKA